MNKAITLLVFVVTFALCAKAGVGFGTTGTSFEYRPTGALDASKGDEAGGEGGLFWLQQEDGIPVDNVEGAVVTDYAKGAAYDYAAHGTTRNDYLAKTEPATNKFLAVDLGAALDRTILPRDGTTVSNVYLKTTDYDGICADTLVQFSPSVAGPTVDDADRIVVWMRELELDDGRTETNLMVTAGRYAGAYDKIESASYRIASPTVASDTWCRLTIRAISDVTEYRVKTSQEAFAEKAPGFTVYIDGQPAMVDEADYDIGIETVPRKDFLSPESSVLIAERRLVPGLPAAGSSKAVSLSRLSIGGRGAVDDVTFSTQRPSFVATENVFTLNWDSGIREMVCIVSNAEFVVTSKIGAAEVPRRRDFALGTNVYSQVTITNVVYRNDYTNGAWKAENGCRVTNNVFQVYAGVNPIGTISSTCHFARLGTNVADGCVTTIAEAKSLLATNKVKKIVLETDFVIISADKSSGWTFYDKGYFPVATNEDLVLDLNGHTLQGRGSVATVSQTGGRLRITDSSEAKNGRILPPMPLRAGQPVCNTAVKSYADAKWMPPVLTIDAGWYDGLVLVTGKVDQIGGIGHAIRKAICSIEGGSYTNIYDDAYNFYLEQYVTNNVRQYFGLVDDYWTLMSTNGYVWCGAGANSRWTNEDNWRGRAVPGAGDLAIFPATNGAWSVDFGAGVATKSLWLDGDVAMSGTNEFSDVKVVSGKGRFVGAGVMTFTGKLPGMLTGDAGKGEIRLGTGWAGLVRISSVTSKAELLTDIMGWGNSRSKVEFNGVRGYVSDRLNHEMSYELVLTDLVTDGGAKTNVAWKNETGYTGSVISFPKLSGSGTFDSPKNLREILQVIQFMDVKDFTGSFKIGGKRLLLGTGVVTSQAKAGHFTFSNDVNVRSGLGWSGVGAHFGDGLYVQGQTNDVLMAYTDAKSVPSVEHVTVMLVGPDWTTTNECSLAIAGKNIVVTNVVKMSRRETMVGGDSVMAEDVGKSVKSGETFVIPAGSAVSIVGNKVIVNGTVVSTFANYYVVQQIDGTTYSVEFDEDEATPTLAEFSVSDADGTVTIKVDNAQDGLWYGLQTVSSLAEEWQGPTEWMQPDDGMLTFNPNLGDTATFFRVLVTDRDPNGGTK